ncbi:hypothetical protein RQP46_006739 [Phenoliferia psychrophenolica]
MHHILALLIPAWGHTAPYLYLALRMLEVDPEFVITVVQHQLVVPQMEAELATCSFDTTRLKIVSIGDPAIDFSVKSVEHAFEQVVTGFLALLPSFVAPRSEGDWPAPKAFHLDQFVVSPCIELLRQSAGPGVKVVAWFSAGAVSMLSHFADHDHEKIANDVYQDESRRRGRSFDEILEDIRMAGNGTDVISGAIVKHPGAPDMYDWETQAHGTTVSPGFGRLFVGMQKFAREADAIVVAASPALEPEGVYKNRDFYRKQGKSTFHVGPQVHAECWTPSETSKVSDERLASFLKTAVESYGPKSVLYISFGSLFFPLTTPHLVRALVETLLDLEQPFPSISQSLSQRIPLIVWPVNAEQPLNAALVSSGPRPVAFELFQIRTGTALAPTLRAPTLKIIGTEADAVREFKNVFEKARETAGMKMREAAEAIARELRESREGEDRSEVARLAAF